MRKILIPIDFSENALNALDYALELFKNDICKFFIMHAFQEEIYADKTLIERMSIEEVTQIISDKSKLQLEDVLKHVNTININPNYTFQTISSNNKLIYEADKIVDKNNIDVIVMGTRGKTNDRKLTFGSQTLQVLKYVQCPVLAIPENYKLIQLKQILFPTNYMIPYKKRELKLLCEIVSPYKAIIDILYNSKSKKLSLRQENQQQLIKDELCKNAINFNTTNHKKTIDAIYTHIKENSIDMLVMVNPRHSFLENILFQSTLDKISLHIEIPFLVLQNLQRY